MRVLYTIMYIIYLHYPDESPVYNYRISYSLHFQMRVLYTIMYIIYLHFQMRVLYTIMYSIHLHFQMRVLYTIMYSIYLPFPNEGPVYNYVYHIFTISKWVSCIQLCIAYIYHFQMTDPVYNYVYHTIYHFQMRVLYTIMYIIYLPFPDEGPVYDYV